MKLLKKTTRQYLLFSFLALLIAIPVFYLVLKWIVQEDIDEDIQSARAQMMPRLKDAIARGKQGDFLFLDHDIAFANSARKKSFDTLYNITIPDTATGEMVPHRVLETHFEAGKHFYKLVIRTSLVDTEGLIEAVLLMEIVLLVLLFIGLQLVNRRLSRRIWQPFYQTVHRLTAYKVEEETPLKLPASDIYEFRDLNRAVEKLTERNRAAFLSQKEFAENASHEMQTPLAVSQSKLELLMQTNPLSEEQSILISAIAQANQRLARLNRSLLLLTRLDNNQFYEKETLVVEEEIQQQLELYEDPIAKKCIQTFVQAEKGVTIQCNRTLFEILLANLFANGIRHTIENGVLEISSSTQWLEVSNTARNGALDNTLFQRFRKDSTDVNSIGLGLEIARKICEINGFLLSYSFLHEMHRFKIQFSPSN